MVIALRNIHKVYGTMSANRGIDLTIESGVIHGLLGENGAGKSTLMKILAGYTPKTSGEIFVDGSPVSYSTPEQAALLNIGMLYQDPLDFPELTVLDNFRLGQPVGFFQNRSLFHDRLVQLSRKFKFNLSPFALVKSLTLGERQQLEMLRLLALGIQIMILDEPTTGISSEQKEILFKALKRLARDGKSVILVSHKLEDVEALCDRVTVLRQGQVSGELAQPFDTHRLLQMMFGALPAPPARLDRRPGDAVLSMNRVSASGGRSGLQNCTVTIRHGEVVGLAGLEGSGQGVFLRVAAGFKAPAGGDLVLGGTKATGGNYHSFQRAGVSFLPGTRLEEGLISGLSIAEHFALQDHRKGFFIRWSDAVQKADSRINNFRIKGTSNSTVESLSGGNQQRLLLSFLPKAPRLLLLENPTRGLDMDSANWVWQHLLSYCKKSTGIIFSSPELDEILMVADRVLVFFDGEIVKDVRTDETDAHELGSAIAGRAGQTT
jgi:general nucleoside transport system ATP-binding protein